MSFGKIENKFYIALLLLQNFIMYFQVHDGLSCIRVGAVLFQAREHYHIQGEKQWIERGNAMARDDIVKCKGRLSSNLHKTI